MKNSTMRLYWHFASVICLTLFMILGYIVKFYESTVLRIDQPIMDWIVTIRSSYMTSFFTWITKFGNTLSVVFIVLAIVVLLWKSQRKVECYWLVLNTAIISGVGNYLIKFLYSRERPGIEHLVSASHYSFPSGHAMISILLWSTVFLMLLPYAKGSWKIKALQIFCVIFALLIGMSRNYLGVHYPSDILGGYLLGASWLCFSYPHFVKYRLLQVFNQ
ncbi:phosphatase PAP2 family protein [Vagococcus zengguangii]|uniref:phosphatase PAP2 family protein n=1 Tax=Vagococcus zengguangii TaxID=2571750 RepID=UPI001109D694|nr:phosphatase PAP2 family protein [Vagococcus zengguangii]TLG79502.1 phosphatase PAP2 family protein [Vagococcus zengguangii]